MHADYIYIYIRYLFCMTLKCKRHMTECLNDVKIVKVSEKVRFMQRFRRVPTFAKPGEAMAFASHICAQGIPQGRMFANKDVLSIVKIRRACFW